MNSKLDEGRFPDRAAGAWSFEKDDIIWLSSNSSLAQIPSVRSNKNLGFEAKGIQYLRTLHLGECSRETTRAIDRLIVAPYEDSFLRFSFLVSQETRFPAVGQIKYICTHQKNICNLHTGNFFDTIQDLPCQIQRRVLSSITELSFALTRPTDEMDSPLTVSQIRSIESPCWPMEMVNSPNFRKLELFFNWRGYKPRLASVFSVHLLPLLRFKVPSVMQRS